MADEVEMTPISADELPPKATPFAAPAAAAPVPPAAPAAPAEPAAPAAPAVQSRPTVRLMKPIIRKPVIRKPGEAASAAPAPAAPAASAPAPAAPAPAAEKKATKSLNSVTGPIPAQATLRKTGIIADGILTPAQQQAAKSKTSRISLESAIGVAPVSPKGPAPLKTIRLRRPADLHKPAAPMAAAPQPAPLKSSTAPLTPPPEAAAPVEEAAPAADAAVTQKKTLKLQRPSGGLKRPSLVAPPTMPASGDIPDLPSGEMADLPDVPDMAPADLPPVAAASDMPAWLTAITLVSSIAALLVLAAVFYLLFSEGCAPVAGGNYSARNAV